MHSIWCGLYTGFSHVKQAYPIFPTQQKYSVFYKKNEIEEVMLFFVISEIKGAEEIGP